MRCRDGWFLLLCLLDNVEDENLPDNMLQTKTKTAPPLVCVRHKAPATFVCWYVLVPLSKCRPPCSYILWSIHPPTPPPPPPQQCFFIASNICISASIPLDNCQHLYSTTPKRTKKRTKTKKKRSSSSSRHRQMHNTHLQAEPSASYLARDVQRPLAHRGTDSTTSRASSHPDCYARPKNSSSPSSDVLQLPNSSPAG